MTKNNSLGRYLRSVVSGIALTALSASAAFAAGTITIGLGVNINTLDPHMSATVPSDLSLLSHIYPALVLRGPDMKLQPSLATEWEVVDDLTWRFKLVEGAKFDTGEPIDASAVKWNVDRVKAPETKARIASWFNLIDSVTVVDPTTVEIKTSAAYPALADQLSMFFLLPPTWAQEHNPAAEAASGGPYRISENVPGDHVTLVPNPDYWGTPAQFDQVTFRTIPETASRVAALLSGEVDWISDVPGSEAARINESGSATADAIASTRSMFVGFNQEKAPIDNLMFRQALNYAINKDAIVLSVFAGFGEVSSCQVLSPAYFGYNHDLKPYPYDPEKARELLAQSGVDLSQQIELEVPLGRYLQATEVGEIIAAMLTEVGLNVKITEIEFGTWLTKRTTGRDQGQLAYQGFGWPTLDADGLLTLFSPGNTYDYWNNQEFGALITEARSTTDQEKRRELYQQATKVMCDDAGTLFLYQQPLIYGLSHNITWQARGDEWIRAMDVASKQ